MEDFTRVFISYHRSDTEADAGRLGDTLKRRLGDQRVFTDVTEIELGANRERVVDHTLQGSVAMLLVMGPGWILTDSIQYELGIALDSGVSIIPVMVRGAKWETLTGDLPPRFRPIQKLNAVELNHSTWAGDLEPLIALLERMIADPARARVISKPPEPISLLRTALDRKNVRSLLVHAADLAYCLDDPSILVEAQQQAPKHSLGSRETLTGGEAPPGLIYALGNARYRLMMEQIGRDILQNSPAKRAAQYLEDAALEEEIRRTWEEFEEVRRVWSATRGDCTESPGTYHRAAIEADARAKDRLRAQLPGLTRQEARRDSLFKLVENQVTDILSRGRIEDNWDYTILKRFSSYPDMRFKLYDSDFPKARDMLERFLMSTESQWMLDDER